MDYFAYFNGDNIEAFSSSSNASAVRFMRKRYTDKGAGIIIAPLREKGDLNSKAFFDYASSLSKRHAGPAKVVNPKEMYMYDIK